MKAILTIFTALAFCLIPMHAAERVALVIGNNDYKHAKPLANPVRDCVVIGEQLEKGGWKVTPVKNAGVLAMRKAVREFCESARDAEAALVFYAGHGIEVKGKNYLLPVDAKLSDEAGVDALPLETLGLDEMLQSLGASGARLKIVVLDSCRDNPLSRSWLSGRSNGGGLAEVGEKVLAEGTMLVFSTAPGEVAADGVGDNSPFTTALSARMTKGGTVADIFGDAAVAMGARQEAWIRFDGSGRSFAAFRAFPLFDGDGVSPAVIPQEPPIPVANDTVKLPTLPATGYFDLSELYSGGAYANYNDHSRSQILRKVQQKFKDLGFYSSKADGIPGPNTQHAIMAWQRAQSMNVTGLLDANTLDKLELASIDEMQPPSTQNTKEESLNRPESSPEERARMAEKMTQDFQRQLDKSETYRRRIEAAEQRSR